MKQNKAWFSIIEILIWIFIFTLGLVSIYALLLSTMKLNDYSKNSIIASNLARESIEIVRNVRDSNYKKLFKWNKFPWSDVNATFQTGVYYKIENNLWNISWENIKVEIISDFAEGKNELLGKMTHYQLCLTGENIYTYDCNTSHTPTYFYRYVKFDDVIYQEWGSDQKLENALKMTTKVIWYNRWYHEIQIDTILTDFLRQ